MVVGRPGYSLIRFRVRVIESRSHGLRLGPRGPGHCSGLELVILREKKGEPEVRSLALCALDWAHWQYPHHRDRPSTHGQARRPRTAASAAAGLLNWRRPSDRRLRVGAGVAGYYTHYTPCHSGSPKIGPAAFGRSVLLLPGLLSLLPLLLPL